ncbi:hypothetical protein EVAR_7485_1 [Eumeta japonica]|uniref:Uncharacterized protein n=1 Tax=Eumeta variegata TaxID=151549 RepID=A0A4C1Y6M5_EUMVA|nr:hypothetical protein EVAR_7485_1 [Eumeta japonica]
MESRGFAEVIFVKRELFLRKNRAGQGGGVGGARAAAREPPAPRPPRPARYHPHKTPRKSNSAAAAMTFYTGYLLVLARCHDVRPVATEIRFYVALNIC